MTINTGFDVRPSSQLGCVSPSSAACCLCDLRLVIYLPASVPSSVKWSGGKFVQI